MQVPCALAACTHITAPTNDDLPGTKWQRIFKCFSEITICFVIMSHLLREWTPILG